MTFHTRWQYDPTRDRLDRWVRGRPLRLDTPADRGALCGLRSTEAVAMVRDGLPWNRREEWDQAGLVKSGRMVASGDGAFELLVDPLRDDLGVRVGASMLVELEAAGLREAGRGPDGQRWFRWHACVDAWARAMAVRAELRALAA